VKLSENSVAMAAMTADVLSGIKPADIPFYQQAKLEPGLNRKTAISLGLEFPTSLLAVADEVIEYCSTYVSV
jgi:putative ABC transport system substrate-binding protein